MKKSILLFGVILITILSSFLTIDAQNAEDFIVIHSFKQLAINPLPIDCKTFGAQIINPRNIKIGHMDRVSNPKMHSGHEDNYVDDNNTYIEKYLTIPDLVRSVSNPNIHISLEIGNYNLISTEPYGIGENYTNTVKFNFSFLLLVKSYDGIVLLKKEIFSPDQVHTKILTRNTPGQGHPVYEGVARTELVIEEAFQIASDILRNNFATPVVNEEIEIYSAKAKKFDYSELDKAKDDFIEAVKIINSQSLTADAKELLKGSIETWQNALLESDFSNQKSRINNEIASCLYLNIANSYLLLNDFDKANSSIKELKDKNQSIKSKLERKVNKLSDTIIDREKRFKAN